MTDIEVEEEQPPVAHVTVVYTGPAAPHWDLQVRYGDQKLIDDFWARVGARLLLLPKHDPQFRRNRERVNRDAERELITCDWDLGDEESESNSSGQNSRNGQSAPVVEAPTDEASPAVEEAETSSTEQGSPAEDGTSAEETPAADQAPPPDEASTSEHASPAADQAPPPDEASTSEDASPADASSEEE